MLDKQYEHAVDELKSIGVPSSELSTIALMDILIHFEVVLPNGRSVDEAGPLHGRYNAAAIVCAVLGRSDPDDLKAVYVGHKYSSDQLRAADEEWVKRIVDAGGEVKGWF